jgi:hypothetical protein
VSFTRGGQPALTSVFGTFFIGNTPTPEGESISGIAVSGANGQGLGGGLAGLTSQGGSTFLGFATVDGSSGDLVPAISEITVTAGSHGGGPEPDLDNFTFASPVSPVPEANAWVLLAAAALAGRVRWRARTTA